MSSSINDGEFKTLTDLVNHAIRFYFENRDQPHPKDQFKAWIVSEDGEQFIKGVILKVQEEKKNHG